MSSFFSSRFNKLVPYTPGEQPRERTYIKLNTNESPFPPSPLAAKKAAAAAGKLQLYSDPTCKALVQAAASYYGIEENQVIFTNGSDDVLNFAFMAFCDKDNPVAFPDITYGFYSVFADLHGIDTKLIPLKKDFTIDVENYKGLNHTIFIANPNAPTGIALSLADIEIILQTNPGHVVVIDEAYVDFGNESAVSLIDKYDNLLVTQTFSKSRSLAGGRLGMGFGNPELIQDLNTIRYSTNPYNINAMTMAAGIGALEDEAYFRNNCQEIIKTRETTKKSLKSLGFDYTDSTTNFIFARHPSYDGKSIYTKLREKGILVRHFDAPRITDYNRITVGSSEEMEQLVVALTEIVSE